MALQIATIRPNSIYIDLRRFTSPYIDLHPAVARLADFAA
jgi:hypothetical protein